MISTTGDEFQEGTCRQCSEEVLHPLASGEIVDNRHQVSRHAIPIHKNKHAGTHFHRQSHYWSREFSKALTLTSLFGIMW